MWALKGDITEPQLGLDAKPSIAITLSREAFAHLADACTVMTDDVVTAPSNLPHWTVGHVLTHIARNAEGHTLRLRAALDGFDVARYPGGSDQRNREIADGAARRARDIVDDVLSTQAQLESVWSQHVAADWPHPHMLGADTWPITESPARRLREIEMHHVDLGLGYLQTQWSKEYVDWDLSNLLETLAHRIGSSDRPAVLSWLAGRGPQPHRLELGPWI